MQVTEYTKAVIIGLDRQGNTPETIAGITGVPLEQVKEIIRVYKLNIALYDQRN